MARVRLSERDIEEYHKQKAFLKDCIKTWDNFKADSDRPSFVTLKGKIESAVKRNEEALLRLVKNPSIGGARKDRDKQMGLVGKISAFQEILADMKYPEEKIEQAKIEIDHISHKLAEARENGGLVATI